MIRSILIAWAVLFPLHFPAYSAPVTSSFTYQGRILDSGAPATGTYDLRFSLHSGATAGTQIESDLVLEDVPVTNGLFSAQLDFGAAAFDGEQRWLQMGVRPGGATGAFVELPMRQALSPVPQAQFALVAGSVAEGGVTAGQIAPNAVTTEKIADGAVSAAKIGSGQVVKSLNGLRDNVTLAAGANVSLSANGNQIQIAAETASHTHAAADLASGTLSDARLSSNVPLFDRPVQTFAGNVNFIPSSGGVGIGTLNADDLLEMRGPDATARIQDSNDLLGTFMGHASGMLQLGMYNFSEVINLPILPGTKRSFFGMDANGAVGTLENRFGDVVSAADFRVTLDDGNGRMRFPGLMGQKLNLYEDSYGIGVQNNTLYERSNGGFAWYRGGTHISEELNPGAGGTRLMSLSPEGNLEVNNMPGLQFAQTVRPDGNRVIIQVDEGVPKTVDEVSVRVPAAGYLFISAFLEPFAGNGFAGYNFQLFDVTGNPEELLYTSGNPTNPAQPLIWVLQVNGPGYINLKTICDLYDDGSAANVKFFTYVHHNLTAIYFPVRYQ